MLATQTPLLPALSALKQTWEQKKLPLRSEQLLGKQSHMYFSLQRVQKFSLGSTPVLLFPPWLCLWMVLLKQDRGELVFITSRVEMGRTAALVLP